MRIVLIAHPTLGSKVLEAVIEKGEAVTGVFIPGADPLKASPLKITARKNHIPVYEPGNMKDNGILETMASGKPELGVLAFVQDIVPLPVLNCPDKGTIMYHPSFLPRHRGGSAMNWTIILGEEKTGLSIIWPDAGIDTGPILLQREVDILPDDTVSSLFFDKLYPMGVAALTEAIRLIEKGKAPRTPQDESRATYEPLCRERHGIINWARPAREVYNLIRGTNPRPGAGTTYQGAKLKIFDSGLTEVVSPANPGEIMLTTDEGFTVACFDGGIMVRQVKNAASGKVSAAEFIRSTGLNTGDRLG